MICSRREAVLFPSRVDISRRGERARSHQLFNAANATFRASRSLPDYSTERPDAGKPGANSNRYVTTRRVAGVGFARSKNYRQHGRRYNGDLGLHLLLQLPVLPV